MIGIVDRRHLTGTGKFLIASLAVLLIAALTLGSLLMTRSKADAAYITQPAARQDLSSSVTASGTVNPQNTVNVGTQVSGTISAIYADYNTKVHQGQVLAKIDTSQMQAQLAQAQAALAQAQAQAAAQQQSAGGAQANVSVQQATSAAQSENAQAAQAAISTADANVTKAQNALQLAQQTLSRDRTLLSQGYIAQSQYDTDQSAYVAAQSALQSAQAAVTQAKAQAASSASQAQAGAAQNAVTAAQAGASADTAQAAQAAVAAAQAQVQQDQLNMQRAVITSPVDGVVIARDVNVGQTVAASLQTPTLFSIAQNLHKMEVDINVGEPDIGNVRQGEDVSFSVLAYPNQTFHGKVSQVRVNPTTVNNVVTYDVITLVDNPQDKLLPGMTANATINVQTVKNALVVPVQALSFRPSGITFTPKHSRSASTKSGSPWGQTSAAATGAAAAGQNGVIFVERDGKPAPLRVNVQLTNGTLAAVTPLRGTLAPGDQVITGQAGQSSSHSHTGSSSQTRGGFAGPGGMGGVGRAIR
jgi:HlyD family secretion protein